MEHIPIFRYAAVGGGGVTVDFTALGIMGSLYILNKAADAAYMSLTNVIPPASLGDNRKQLAENEAVNLDNIEFTYVSLSSAGASTIEMVVVQRPGAVGGGEL